MDIASVGLFVDGKGAIQTLNQFTGSAHNAGRAVSSLEGRVGSLGTALRSFVAYFGIRQLVEYADTWTLINARINLVTETTQDTIVVQQELYDISQRTRNTMAATSVLYTRLALNAHELGRSHRELLDVVESVNSAMLISGATGVEAAQGMRQLAQALGSGRLQGDEFRTVMEAMPKVAEAIAKQLNVTRGELYKLSREGKIGVNDIIEALLKANDELKKQAATIPLTIGQSFTYFFNAVERMVGILNRAGGASKGLAGFIRDLANNMDKVVAVVGVLAGAWIAYESAALGAWLVTQFFIAGETILGFIKLARSIEATAAAMTVLKAVGTGLVGVLAMVAAAGLGYVAYQKLLEKIHAETEKWLSAQGDLNDKIGKFTPKPDEAYLKLLEKTNNEIEDMLRKANQGLLLSAQDARNQDRLQIVMDAVNKRVIARRELTGDLLTRMLEAIDAERDLRLRTEETAYATDQATDAAKKHAQTMKNFAEQMQKTFSDAFFDILSTGTKTFKDLFTSIKNAFLHMIADVLAADAMKKWGAQLAAVVGAATPAKASTMTAEQMEAYVKAGKPGAPIPVSVEDVNANALRELGGRVAAYLGPAIAGFGVGSAIGSLTTNKRLGALGGAVSGAAVGAMIGSVVPIVGTAAGAAIGGLTGAIGGLIGASNKLEEEMKRHREVMESNNNAIEQLRSTLYGDSLGQRLSRAPDAMGRIEIWGASTKADVLLIKRIATELGITLDRTAESWEQLKVAIELAGKAITTFGNNLNDQQKRLEAFNKIFGVKSTPQQQIDIIRKLAPDLAAKVGLGPGASREQAMASFKEIFNLIESGQLTPELLGAFADKNELLDAILRTTDAFDELNKSMTRVTTDFPRAMDLIFYENQYGRYGNTRTNANAFGNNTSQGRTTGIQVNGDLIIQTNGDETGDEVLDKVERASVRRAARGGFVTMKVRDPQ